MNLAIDKKSKLTLGIFLGSIFVFTFLFNILQAARIPISSDGATFVIMAESVLN